MHKGTVARAQGRPMKIIAFAAQKGGVGKTTLAVNLAVRAAALGIRTVLFDLDPQESATAWSERRSAELPHVEPLSSRRLSDGIAAAETQGFQLSIIDTPPAQGDQALTAAELAELVVVPCRPSLVDLDAIQATGRLLKSTTTSGLVVLNAAPPTATQLINDARMIAEGTGMQVARTVVRERSAFRAAWPTGQGVTEYEPAGKAAAEIDELTRFLLSVVHLSPGAQVQKRKAAK